MKTEKKIAVGLAAALVVAIFAAGAVSMAGAQLEGSVEYSAVVSGIDVSINENVVTDFSVVVPGGDPVVIEESFILTNAGDLTADVSASFAGLFDGVKKIPAECLSIKGVPLSESDTDIVTVGAESSVTFDAALSVPADQEPGSYSGTVELTFSIVPA